MLKTVQLKLAKPYSVFQYQVKCFGTKQNLLGSTPNFTIFNKILGH